MAFSMQMYCRRLQPLWPNLGQFYPGIQNLNLVIIQKPNFHLWSLLKFGISLHNECVYLIFSKKKKKKVTINQNIQKLNIHKEEKPQKRNPNAGPIYVEQLKTEERPGMDIRILHDFGKIFCLKKMGRIVYRSCIEINLDIIIKKKKST